jgi:hypothetical protein
MFRTIKKVTITTTSRESSSTYPKQLVWIIYGLLCSLHCLVCNKTKPTAYEREKKNNFQPLVAEFKTEKS